MTQPSRFYRSFTALIAIIFSLATLLTAPATNAAGGTVSSASTSTTVANGVEITLAEVTYNDDDTSTWRYTVAKAAGAENVTSWVLALPTCSTVTASTPAGTEVTSDADTGLSGIKWNLDAGFTQGEFSVTLSGPVMVGAGQAGVGGADQAPATVAGPVCTSAPLAREVSLSNGYEVTFLGVEFNADGTSTWRYNMTELATAQDLSNWVLALPHCQIVSASPSPWEAVHPDPNANLYGIKWQTGAGFTEGEFSVTLTGPVTMGVTQVSAKGPDVVQGQILGVLATGASCTSTPPANIIIVEPEIEIKIENNITFVLMDLELTNEGGAAKHTFLHIKVDASFELADLSWLEGIGYVAEMEDGVIKIGLGENNLVTAAGKLKLKIKFKSHKHGVKFKLKLHLTYDDSSGYVESDPVEVEEPSDGTTDDEDDAAEDDAAEDDAAEDDAAEDDAAEEEVDESQIVRLPLESIDVHFKMHWKSKGGLRHYGYPVSEPMTLDSGVIIQYFERARFEYHPELEGTEYEVLLGLLAVELGYGEPAVAEPTAEDDREWYFEETGHTIAAEFRDFWANEGGLMAFGYPIGEAFVDENGRLVQYFERTRLEFHPENAATEYDVLLGFLGIEVMMQEQ